jgi:ParB-like chromosome segregation protein Spo0J
MTTVPVVWVDMTTEQRRISTLRHNRARGTEDHGLASDLLRDLEARGAGDFALEALNMSADELEQIIADGRSPETDQSPEVVRAIETNPNDMAAIADARRAAEGRIMEEKVGQATVQLAIERNVFRLDLTYTGDEGNVVKRVLGQYPGRKLVEIAQASLQTPA